MESLNTHKKLFGYCLQVIFVLVIFTAILSLLNGCSTHKNTSQSSKIYEYKQVGIASYYGDTFQSRKTASGERFDNNLMTAAHKTLPFGTHVLVTNVNNGKSVKVKINDRGPFSQKRIIDLSKAAFAKIEDLGKGLTKVEIMTIE